MTYKKHYFEVQCKNSYPVGFLVSSEKHNSWKIYVFTKACKNDFSRVWFSTHYACSVESLPHVQLLT